jgi:putative permease
MVIIAGLLAYLLSWPVERLARHMRRPFAVTLVFFIFAILLLGLFSSFVPILAEQVTDLVNTIPFMFSKLEDAAAGWRLTVFPGREYVLADFLPNFDTMLEERTPEFVSNVFNYTQSIVTGTVAAALFVVPLTLYFC